MVSSEEVASVLVEFSINQIINLIVEFGNVSLAYKDVARFIKVRGLRKIVS